MKKLIAAGAANTFTAVSGSDWNTAANWSEGVPVAGQAVVIDGDATLTNATPMESLQDYLGAAPTVAFGTAATGVVDHGKSGTILYLNGQPVATMVTPHAWHTSCLREKRLIWHSPDPDEPPRHDAAGGVFS